jgi:hypothetical protein
MPNMQYAAASKFLSDLSWFHVEICRLLHVGFTLNGSIVAREQNRARGGLFEGHP